jgi:hypothetical protein
MLKKFSNLMQIEYGKSMIGKLKFFVGLQIKQHFDDIIICQEKYVKDFLKKFKKNKVKIMITLMHLLLLL